LILTINAGGQNNKTCKQNKHLPQFIALIFCSNTLAWWQLPMAQMVSRYLFCLGYDKKYI